MLHYWNSKPRPLPLKETVDDILPKRRSLLDDIILGSSITLGGYLFAYILVNSLDYLTNGTLPSGLFSSGILP